MSTLREPYRIEGKKTLGLELAMQFGWTLPDAIIYPTGGGTGLIGMWKAFIELLGTPAGSRATLPRMYSVQSSGCAPVVAAFAVGRRPVRTVARSVDRGERAPRARPPGRPPDAPDAPRDRRWRDRGRRSELEREAGGGTREEGVDLSPEGGAALAAAGSLRASGVLNPEDRVVAFNTGAGWLYRDPGDLPPV